MVETATGLVLRTRPLTETSLIVQWLTQTLGRISTVAKGALRPKSNFRGKLDLFYLAEFSFARSRRSELHTLREVNLKQAHAALRRDLDYVHQASYCAALIEQTTETETPLPEIFELMNEFLRVLPARPPEGQKILAFEIKLLNQLGLQPDLEKSRLSPGATQILQRLAETEWHSLANLKASQAQKAELERFLHGFLIFHLGKIPRNRSAALSGHLQE